MSSRAIASIYSTSRFRDRAEGGARLAALLQPYRLDRPFVIARSPGAFAVAVEVALALDVELQAPEPSSSWPDLRQRTVLVLSDGLDAAEELLAVVAAVDHQAPVRIVVAAPVLCARVIESLVDHFRDVITVGVIETVTLDQVRACYQDAGPIDDGGLATLRARLQGRRPQQRRLLIPTGGEPLGGELRVPVGARGVVLLAGAGALRVELARELAAHGFAQLVIDDKSLHPAHGRVEVEWVARRLAAAIDWLRDDAATALLHVGVVACADAAAPALLAATWRPGLTGALVLVEGDLTTVLDAACHVHAATLLLAATAAADAGGAVAVCQRLGGVRSLQDIATSGNLLADAEARATAARLAARWLTCELAPHQPTI